LKAAAKPPFLIPNYAIAYELHEFTPNKNIKPKLCFINPNYALNHELHELTQIKTIKSIDLDLYENSLRGLLVILLIFFMFIRVIRGLMHYLG